VGKAYQAYLTQPGDGFEIKLGKKARSGGFLLVRSTDENEASVQLCYG